MRRSLILTAWVLVALAPATMAQAELVNIDMGPLSSLPLATFAAAGQAGVWNSYEGGNVSSLPLLDLNGLPTDVTIFADAGIYTSASLGYTGSVAALMNDVLDTPLSITINGLDPGNYDILTYASDPDSPTLYGTMVTIGGVTKTVIGPAVSGGVFIENTHYARHSIVHPGGPLEITLATGGTSFWNVNGIQIIPEPAALALVGLTAPILLRRRR